MAPPIPLPPPVHQSSSPTSAPIPIPRKQVVIVALFMTMFGMFLLPFRSARLLQHLFMLMPGTGQVPWSSPPMLRRSSPDSGTPFKCPSIGIVNRVRGGKFVPPTGKLAKSGGRVTIKLSKPQPLDVWQVSPVSSSCHLPPGEEDPHSFSLHLSIMI